MSKNVVGLGDIGVRCPCVAIESIIHLLVSDFESETFNFSTLLESLQVSTRVQTRLMKGRPKPQRRIPSAPRNRRLSSPDTRPTLWDISGDYFPVTSCHRLQTDVTKGIARLGLTRGIGRRLDCPQRLSTANSAFEARHLTIHRRVA